MDFAKSLVAGKDLTPEDHEFVSVLLKELDNFQRSAPKDRALMFEPLHGFHRHLIHRVTESFPKLCSFTIRDDRGKRTVVCFSSNRNKQKEAHGSQFHIEPVQPSPATSEYLQRGRRSLQQRPSHPSLSSRSRDTRASTAPRSVKRSEAASRASSRPRRPERAGRSLSSNSSPVRRDERRRRDFHDDDDDEEVPLGRFNTERGPRRPTENGSGDKRRGRSSCPSSPRRSRRREASASSKKKSRESSLRRPDAKHSGASLERRMRGLQLEGQVINGDSSDTGDDVETQYSSSTSKDRRQNKTQRSISPSSPARSSCTSRLATTRKSADHSEHYSSSAREDDDAINSADTEDPPSYDSVRPKSLSKVRRNLDRIKRTSSTHRSNDSSRRQMTSDSRKMGRSQSVPRKTRDTLTRNAGTQCSREETKIKTSKKKSLSNDTLLDGSNNTLYMSLPADQKPQIEASKSRSSSKRREKNKTFSKTSTDSIPTEKEETKPTEADISPDMLQAFREFLNQQQDAAASQPAPSTSNIIPAELAHQLYLSYLSAYCAGATGVWPPPAPPSYIMPQHVRNNPQYPFLQTPAFANLLPSYDDPKTSSTYYPYLPTAFPTSSDFPPSADKTHSSGAEDYAPSPAAYQNDAVTSHVRRYSLERACQSDSCKSSACGDEVASNHRATTSDVSCNSSVTRNSEIAVSSTSKGNVVVYVRSRANSSDSKRSEELPHPTSTKKSRRSYQPRDQSIEKKRGEMVTSSSPALMSSHDDVTTQQPNASINDIPLIGSNPHVRKTPNPTSSRPTNQPPPSSTFTNSVEMEPSIPPQPTSDSDISFPHEDIRHAPLALMDDDVTTDDKMSHASSISALSSIIDLVEPHKVVTKQPEPEVVATDSGAHLPATPHLPGYSEVISSDVEVKDIKATNRLLQPPPRTTSFGSVETNPTTEESSTPVSSPSGNGSADQASDQDTNQIKPTTNNIADKKESYAYYNCKQASKWKDEKYQCFVEVYDFNPELEDKELAKNFHSFKGLRMNRVSRFHALCLLPTLEDAEKMLKQKFETFKVRSLESASDRSKSKAERKVADKELGRRSTLSLSSNISRNPSIASRSATARPSSSKRS